MKRAKYAAMRERSVGLGVMGFHSFLQSKMIPMEGVMAKVWNKRMFQHIKRRRDDASVKLAHERGACPDAQGLRHHGAFLEQDGDRADGVDLDHHRRRVARHRAECTRTPTRTRHCRDRISSVKNQYLAKSCSSKKA
jgi:ribonucleotide reductase alpha subunit